MIKLYQSPVSFDVIEHTYTLGDRKLIGVTELMSKHGLSADYSGVPARTLRNAADYGSYIHGLVQDWVNGLAMETSDFERDFFKSFDEFLHDMNHKIVCAEYLVSDEKSVASKIDLVMDDYALVDFKTTSKIYRGPLSWQLSIYAYLFEKCNHVKVPYLLCIHYDKNTGKFTEHAVKRLPDSEVERLLDCEARGEKFVQNLEGQSIGDIVAAKNLPALMNKIYAAKEVVKALEEKVKEITDGLYQGMLDSNIDKFEGDGWKLTLKRPYTRATIDSAKLKADLPDIAEKYTKTSTVKGSVSFELTENK